MSAIDIIAKEFRVNRSAPPVIARWPEPHTPKHSPRRRAATIVILALASWGVIFALYAVALHFPH